MTTTKLVSYCSQRLSSDRWILLPFWKDQIDLFDKEVYEDLSNSPALLTNVPLSIFGATLLNPSKYYPRASKFLPIMADDSIQKSWTGSTGTDLLETSISFVQQLLIFCSQHLQGFKPEMRVLDFGIGWGRIARLWLKYLPPINVLGCDAWEKSIDLANKCHLKNNIEKSDSLLVALPYPEESFDLIYAMSIFTHLNETAFRACFSGVSKMLKVNGGFMLTVRPNIFWESLRTDLPEHLSLSQERGFVFRHGSFDPLFGDTTVDLPWIEELAHDCGLIIVGVEWSPADAMQVLLQLKKVASN
jgi:2-polyprenyl-3-methyl-5-hydroxy-6-metoxy-1,4-benzoquinol methylase